MLECGLERTGFTSQQLSAPTAVLLDLDCTLELPGKRLHAPCSILE